MSYFVPTCRTCRHWKPDVVQHLPPRVDHLCSHPKLGDDMDVDKSAGDALWYEWAEGGGIYTGPNFGCVHHEERP